MARSRATTKTAVEPPAKPDGLQTLDRALAILSIFQPDREEWSAAEAAAELGLGLGTVSRFMRGLAARGFLTRTGRRYRLGYAALDLGHRALSSLGLRNQLRAITVRVARESGETCVLLESSETGGQARVVDRAESDAPVRISIELGLLLPLTTGIGKALLVNIPEETYRLVYGKTIDPRFCAEIAAIRDRGWVVSIEEEERGTWGLSVPIVTPGGVVLAALALIAPIGRRTEENERRLVSLLLQARADAAQLLGFTTSGIA